MKGLNLKLESIVDLTREVWTAGVLSQGMLWPGTLEFSTFMEPGQDSYVAVLYNPGRIYTYAVIEPRALRESERLVDYLDREMRGLQQRHFMAQAHSRGGYS